MVVLKECLTPFDFEELIRFLEKNDKDGIFPKISSNELNTKIQPQIAKIIKEVITISLQKGKCCLPSKEGKTTSNIIYHPKGVDLLIDNNQHVWFIEANPGVGFSLISNDIIDIYKNFGKQNLIPKKI